MKLAIFACLAALTLCSGCMIFDDDFIEGDFAAAPRPSDPAR